MFMVFVFPQSIRRFLVKLIKIQKTQKIFVTNRIQFAVKTHEPRPASPDLTR